MGRVGTLAGTLALGLMTAPAIAHADGVIVPRAAPQTSIVPHQQAAPATPVPAPTPSGSAAPSAGGDDADTGSGYPYPEDLLKPESSKCVGNCQQEWFAYFKGVAQQAEADGDNQVVADF